MLKPKSLQPGDKIGIVATGKKLLPQQIEQAINAFTSWQLQVVLAPNVFKGGHAYLSASDDERRSDIQQMINDPEIRAIICARGGYGTTRIINDIDYSPILSDPKWIVGFSDVTALHLQLFRLGIESIHGTMPVLFSNPLAGKDVDSLRDALFDTAPGIKADPSVSNRYGQAEGRVVGGNLSLLVDSFSTASEPNLDSCILIVEEIEEHLYKIDRMFTQLKRSGKLDGLAGLVVGQMTDLLDTPPGFGESIHEIIRDKVKHLNFPVAFGFPIGHEHPNIAWQHGSLMKLLVNASGSQLEPQTRNQPNL